MLYSMSRKVLFVFLFFPLFLMSGCDNGSSSKEDVTPVVTKEYNPFLIDYISPPPSRAFFGKYTTSYDSYVLFTAYDFSDTQNSKPTVLVYNQEENNSLTLSTYFFYEDTIDSLAMYGDYIAVGSKNYYNKDYDSEGAVTLYKMDLNKSVRKIVTFNANDADDNWDGFGTAVQIYKDYLLVQPTMDTHNVYLFKIDDDENNVTKIAKLSLPEGYDGNFPEAIAIDNDQIAISSTQDSERDIFIYNIEQNDSVSFMDTIVLPVNNVGLKSSLVFKNGYLATVENSFDTLRVYKISRESVTQIAQRNINLDDIRRNFVLSMDDDYILIETNNGGNLALSVYQLEDDNVIQKQDIVFNLPINSYSSALSQNRENVYVGFPFHNTYLGEVYQFNLNAKNDLYVYQNPPKRFDIAEGDTFSYAFDVASPSGAIYYSVSGTDQSYFIDEDNNLTNSVLFDYEHPLDSDADNNYTFDVILEDSLADQKTFPFSVVVHDRQFIKKEMLSIPSSISSRGIAADGNYTILSFWNDNFAYLYKTIDGESIQIAQLDRDNAYNDGYFGMAVALQGRYFAIADPVGNDYSGYVNVYHINDNDTVALIAQIVEDGIKSFGNALTIDHDKLYVGAYSDQNEVDGDGRLFIYQLSDTNVTKLLEYDTQNPSNNYLGRISKIVVAEPYIATVGYAIHIHKMDTNGSLSEIARFDNYLDVALEGTQVAMVGENNITLLNIENNDTFKELSSYPLSEKLSRSNSFSFQNNQLVTCLDYNPIVFHIGEDNNITLFEQLNQYNDLGCSGMVMNAQQDIFMGGYIESKYFLFVYAKDTN